MNRDPLNEVSRLSHFKAGGSDREEVFQVPSEQQSCAGIGRTARDQCVVDSATNDVQGSEFAEVIPKHTRFHSSKDCDSGETFRDGPLSDFGRQPERRRNSSQHGITFQDCMNG